MQKESPGTRFYHVRQGKMTKPSWAASVWACVSSGQDFIQQLLLQCASIFLTATKQVLLWSKAVRKASKLLPFMAIALGCLSACNTAPAPQSGNPVQSQADSYAQLRNRLVDESICAEGVKNQRVIMSMRKTPRHEFMPEPMRNLAYYDMAVAIGNSQTISPPFVVAYMTEQIDPQENDSVLEIGTGSGYQAAILSPLVKDVYTIEIVEVLAKRAEQTLRRLGYNNVHVKSGDGFKGWPEAAPFDKIIVTCSPENVPQALIDQLKEGGRMIIPLGQRYQQSLYLMTKKGGKLQSEALLPTMFVPMTGESEQMRKVQPDASHPVLVNGDFEAVDEKNGKLTNWYYQRQLTPAEEGAAQGKRFALFSNKDAGRGAQAIQAFPVDGRILKALQISGRVRGSDLKNGEHKDETPSLLLVFYDANRKVAKTASLGNWSGSFGWKEFREQVKVPISAREAILHIGLHGAFGELALDDLKIAAQK